MTSFYELINSLVFMVWVCQRRWKNTFLKVFNVQKNEWTQGIFRFLDSNITFEEIILNCSLTIFHQFMVVVRPIKINFSAAEEIKRAAVDLKLSGFQIGSHVGDWNLDAKELYPIYKVRHF
jgi:hypothetical protein